MKFKILVIEDSPSDRRIYRRFLESQSHVQFEIEEAASARNALETCRKDQPDCIILDYRLPDRDGISLMPDLQELTDAPIVFVTGQPEALVMTEAYRHGAVKYLSKDFITAKALQDAVLDALKENHKALR